MLHRTLARRHRIALARRDIFHVVVLGDLGRRLHTGNQALGVGIDRRDGGTHGTALADMERERTRIHILDSDDIALCKEVRQALDALPVARRIAHVMHDEATQMKLPRLHILLVDAVVADLRVRQRDNLASIARIAHDLLIAHHRGVEHHFAEGLPLGTARPSFEDSPVLERQKRLRMLAVVHQKVQDGHLSFVGKTKSPSMGHRGPIYEKREHVTM